MKRVFGEHEYICDVESTRACYQRAIAGGAVSCGCNTCRNFIAARDAVFSPRVVEFLESLGISYEKEAEAYHLGRLAPGIHSYGGWFHFVGELTKTGDLPMVEVAPNFNFWMCGDYAPHLDALESVPRVQLEFTIKEVPWVLNEAEPDS